MPKMNSFYLGKTCVNLNILTVGYSFKRAQIFFGMLWHQVAFILLFTSQLIALSNYLCALDTTLRLLIT